MKSGVFTACNASGIARNAPVHPGVRVLASVSDSEEEQGASRQEDAVTRGGRSQQLAVLVPLDGRGWKAVSLAVESSWFMTGYTEVCRVLCDPRGTELFS